MKKILLVVCVGLLLCPLSAQASLILTPVPPVLILTPVLPEPPPVLLPIPIQPPPKQPAPKVIPVTLVEAPSQSTTPEPDPIPSEDPVSEEPLADQCRRAYKEAVVTAPDLKFDWPFRCTEGKKIGKDRANGTWWINFKTGEQSIDIWLGSIVDYQEMFGVVCHELGHAYLYRAGGDYGNEREADRIAREKCGVDR